MFETSMAFLGQFFNQSASDSLKPSEDPTLVGWSVKGNTKHRQNGIFFLFYRELPQSQLSWFTVVNCQIDNIISTIKLDNYHLNNIIN